MRTSTPRRLRLDQRVDRRLIGDEVGIGNQDRSARADDREVVDDARGRGADGGRAEHAVDGDVARRGNQREEARAADQFAGRLQPVLGEAGLQRHDARPLDLDLHVAPVLRVLGVAGPVIGDARAAGEAQPAVDDERLAMGAVVEAPERAGADRVEPRQLAAARLEDLQDLGADGGRAHRVEQDLDAHPVPRAIRQRRGELHADAALPVDVGLDRDRRRRLAHGAQHRGIELVAVVEQPHPVAVDHRHAGEPDHARQERRRVDGGLVIQAVGRRLLVRRDQVRDERDQREAHRRPPAIERRATRRPPSATAPTTTADGEPASRARGCRAAGASASPAAPAGGAISSGRATSAVTREGGRRSARWRAHQRRTRYGSIGRPCHQRRSGPSLKTAKCRCGASGDALPVDPT